MPVAPNVTESAVHAALITPSDSTDLASPTRAILVKDGGGGDMKVTMVGGETLVIPGVPAGYNPLQVTRVWATSTTATNLIALW